MQARRFVGIDLGKRTWDMCVIDEEGSVSFSNGKTDYAGRQKLYRQLLPTDRVGIEVCSLAMKMSYEMSEQVECEVVPLHAGKLAVIYASLKKTDKEDSLKIARLVRTHENEELPVVTIPTEKEMMLRMLVTEARQLRADRTKLINRMHAIFTSCGRTDVLKKHLATEESRMKIVAGLEGYPKEYALRICGQLKNIETQREVVDLKIQKEVGEDEIARLLMTIPGVGHVTALAFRAYVGDCSRFDNGNQVANYLGLVPRIDISGSQVHYGGITKAGSREVRCLLVMSSWICTCVAKKDSALKQKFAAMAGRGKMRKKAIVCIARKMAVMMYAMVRDRKPFCPPPSTKAACLASEALSVA